MPIITSENQNDCVEDKANCSWVPIGMERSVSGGTFATNWIDGTAKTNTNFQNTMEILKNLDIIMVDIEEAVLTKRTQMAETVILECAGKPTMSAGRRGNSPYAQLRSESQAEDQIGQCNNSGCGYRHKSQTSNKGVGIGCDPARSISTKNSTGVLRIRLRREFTSSGISVNTMVWHRLLQLILTKKDVNSRDIAMIRLTSKLNREAAGSEPTWLVVVELACAHPLQCQRQQNIHGQQAVALDWDKCTQLDYKPGVTVLRQTANSRPNQI